MEEIRNAYEILNGKPEGIISIGRPKRRREENIEVAHARVRTESSWLGVGTTGRFV
jgi:hypothetical protein